MTVRKINTKAFFYGFISALFQGQQIVQCLSVRYVSVANGAIHAGVNVGTLRETCNQKITGSTPVGRTPTFFFRVCLCH